MALQETMLHEGSTFRIPQFNLIAVKGHFNHRSHGEAALLVHEDIPYKKVQLRTAIQAVAALVQLYRKTAICSIYSSGEHELTLHLLEHLLQQLLRSVMKLEDLNEYNEVWGCKTTGARRRLIEEFVKRNELNILNDGSAITFNCKDILSSRCTHLQF